MAQMSVGALIDACRASIEKPSTNMRNRKLLTLCVAVIRGLAAQIQPVPEPEPAVVLTDQPIVLTGVN